MIAFAEALASLIVAAGLIDIFQLTMRMRTLSKRGIIEYYQCIADASRYRG